MSRRDLFRFDGGAGLPFATEDDVWSELDMSCESATEHGYIALLGDPPDGDEVMLFDGAGSGLSCLAAERGLVLWDAIEDPHGELCVEFREPGAGAGGSKGSLRAVVRPVGEAMFLALVGAGAMRDVDRNGLLWGAWRGCGPAFLPASPAYDAFRAYRTAAIGHVTDCHTEEELMRWFHQKDEFLLASSRDWPACWGGQMRVADGGLYVPVETWESVLPTYDEQMVWTAIANCGPGNACGEISSDEILCHVHLWRDERVPPGEIVDLAFFEDATDEALNDMDCPCFYTECCPEELDDDELRRLAKKRPDLATDALEELEARLGHAPANEPLAEQERDAQAPTPERGASAKCREVNR